MYSYKNVKGRSHSVEERISTHSCKSHAISMYVCIFVCLYVCLYVFMYVCMHAQGHLHLQQPGPTELSQARTGARGHNPAAPPHMPIFPKALDGQPNTGFKVCAQSTA